MKWRKAVIAVSITAALGGAFGLMWWMDRQCHVPVGRLAIKATNSIGCFDFWANRYQTLLTGLLALAAAWVAAYPVRQQLKEMSRQTAASARPSILDMVQTLEKEASVLRTSLSEIGPIYRLIEEYDDGAIWQRIYNDWLDTCSKVQRDMNQVHGFLIASVYRHPEDSPLNEARKELITEIGNLESRLGQLRYVFRQQTTGLSPENGEIGRTDSEIEQRRKAIGPALDAWERAHVKVFGMLTSEIQNAWRRLRELERYAVPQTE